jgi:hypothetical protein
MTLSHLEMPKQKARVNNHLLITMRNNKQNYEF